MRGLVLLILGVLIGAAAFHAYYLRLGGPARCGWDHPFDAAACRDADASRRGYAPEARHELDDLIGNVAR